MIPAVGDAAASEACVRALKRHWPRARFEDAETGERYASVGDIPLGRVRELFTYSDDGAEAQWDADRPDSPANSMVYLILAPDSVTAVVDDPSTGGMQAILDSVRAFLRDRPLSPAFDKKHPEDAPREGSQR